jgi:drug/metabolite transporter (DMT)-like permease
VAELSHRKSVWLALLVTFLWSTSWLLIKIGLKDVPPLTFAGLRYMLAFLCLLPFFLRASGRQALRLRSMDRRTWLQMLGYGIIFYTLAQGAQYVSLSRLPAVTLNLILGFNPVVVTLLGIVLLAEVPNWFQWLGVAAAMAGVVVYFYPIQYSGAGQVTGLIAGLVCLLATAYSAVLGRSINRNGSLTPLNVTVISLGFGAPLMLLAGLLTEKWVPIGLVSWLIIAYLAVVNTALAFTLWNLTLRTLPAMESSMINNAMTIQVPVIAVLFLGESLGFKEVVGLALIAMGVLAVQTSRVPFLKRKSLF